MGKEKEIPKTVIKGSGFFNIDLEPLGDNAKLLFFSLSCTVVGVDDFPYLIFATPEFKGDDLPPQLGKDINEVKRIVLQPTFLTEGKVKQHYLIPEWIMNFKKIDYLKLESADLSNLHLIKDLPIERLVLQNVEFSNSDQLVFDLKQIKSLIKISYDESLLPVREKISDALNVILSQE